MEDSYSLQDIARLLGAEPSTVGAWVAVGKLVAFRTPGRHVRVRGSELRDFLLTHDLPMPPELGSRAVKLLVVDEDEAALFATGRALATLGAAFEVSTSVSAAEALLRLSEEPPHALLIDLNLSELNGLEVLRRVRARRQFDAVKVIAMTSRPTPEVAQQAIRLGAAACLTKPVEVTKLLELLKVQARCVVATRPPGRRRR